MIWMVNNLINDQISFHRSKEIKYKQKIKRSIYIKLSINAKNRFSQMPKITEWSSESYIIY